MEKVKSMLAAFFISLGMIILTVLVILFCLGMASYVWQNAHSIDSVFPLMGDYTIICLYGFLKWLGIFAGIGIAAIVSGIVILHEIGLWLEKYKARRMSPIYSEIKAEEGEGGGVVPPGKPLYADPNEVGEAVKDYVAENYMRFRKGFSPYDTGAMAEIYAAIGHTPNTNNEQAYNLNFGKLLLKSKYFEPGGEKGNHIFLNPLYTKEVKKAAEEFKQTNKNYESADLIHEVKKEYGSDKNRTLAGQV